jgi:predicted transcriptional regulator
MSQKLRHGLSKRERQIVEVIYRVREASVSEVRRAMPDPPGYSSVRTTLNILVQKELLSYRRLGRKYLYAPVIPHERARTSAVKQLMQTYFDNSLAAAVSTLLKTHGHGISDDQYEILARLIEESKKRESK